MGDARGGDIQRQGNKGTRTLRQDQIRQNQAGKFAAAEINLQITEAEKQQDEQRRGPARAGYDRITREPQDEAERLRPSLLGGEDSRKSNKN